MPFWSRKHCLKGLESKDWWSKALTGEIKFKFNMKWKISWWILEGKCGMFKCNCSPDLKCMGGKLDISYTFFQLYGFRDFNFSWVLSKRDREIFVIQGLFKNFSFFFFFFFTPLPKANEKKVDQPPEAKKPKIKVVNVELPVEANLVWQLGKDLLNMYIETEVSTSFTNFYFGMCLVWPFYAYF